MKGLLLCSILLLLSPKNLSQWEIVTPKPIADQLTSIFMFDENNSIVSGRAFASSSGVIIKSNNGFNTFERTFIPYTIIDMKFFDTETGYGINLDNHALVKTTNGGTLWYVLPVSGAETVSEYYFCNKDTGFVRTNSNYLYRTFTGGNEWSKIIVPHAVINSLFFVDADYGFLIMDDKNVYKTSDAGTTWTNVLSTYSYSSYQKIAFKDRLNGVVSTLGSSIYKTTDGGVNWSSKPVYANYCKKLIYTPSIIWAYCNLYDSKVIYSTNEGATWISKTLYNDKHSFDTYPNQTRMDVHMLNNYIFYAAGKTGVIAKSTDGGDTWNDLGSVAVISNKIIFTSDGYTFASPNYRSSDGGSTWYIRPTAYGPYNYYHFHFTSNMNGLVAASHGLFRTTDGGDSFNEVFSCSNLGSAYNIQFVDDTTGYFLETYYDYIWEIDYYYLHRSTNGGASWLSSSQWPYTTKNPSKLVFINKNLSFAIVNSFGYRGTDPIITWEYNEFAGCNAFSFLNDSVGFGVRSNGEVIKTYNKGDSFNLLGNIPGYPNCISMVFKDSLNGWVGSTYGIYYTSDGGYNWSMDYPGVSVSDMKRHNNRLYAVTSDEVIIRRDLGVVPVEMTSFTGVIKEGTVELNWSTATEINNKGFYVEKKDNDSYSTLAFIPGKGSTTEKQEYRFSEPIEPGNYTYRLKQVDYNGSFKYSNEVLVEYNIPKDFSLEQNYPNPFNPTTMIKFSIPVNGNVKLKVYDVLGKEIQTLVNEQKAAGEYEVSFGNSRLSSGIYIYRLTTGNFSQSKTMVMVK